MSSVDQLSILEDDGDFEAAEAAYWAARKEAAKERKRERRRNAGKCQYRKVAIPCKNGFPFVIVPQIAHHLHRLAEVAGKEAGVDDQEDSIQGIYILASRAAIILNRNREKPMEVESVARRLRQVIGKKQLFVNANLVEACLMAMDAEHEIQYGEWPATRAAALEQVSIQAELKGEKVSPDKLLARANRLFEKGVRKAYRRACEVTP